jgi:sirohydrochlorin ferrochelatase
MTLETASIAVVLASHGDRGGSQPNAALRSQADAVAALTGLRVWTGVLKGEPTLEGALAEAAASGTARIAVYPLFMADGYFVQKVRERIAAAGFEDKAQLLTPLGLDPALPDLLVESAADSRRHRRAS